MPKLMAGASQTSLLVWPKGNAAHRITSTCFRQWPRGNSSGSCRGSVLTSSSDKASLFSIYGVGDSPYKDNDKLVLGGYVDSRAAAPTIRAIESKKEEIDILTDTSGGDTVGRDKFGDGGSGSGGGGGGGDNRGKGEGGEEPSDSRKKMALSMSQKLTLGYAALVGVGGIMGYLKSGSQKSLLAGGVSASLLYAVYTMLPTNPVAASSLGLGVSAALLAAMGSRFKKSRKVFPAGVVSLVSLVMTAGYLHGIMRSMH